MAQPHGFIEVASGASGINRTLASIPSGVDNAILRVETGTVRWSESPSWVNASVGLLLSAVDQPFRVGGPHGLSNFTFVPLGGAAAVQFVYYTYRGIGQYL